MANPTTQCREIHTLRKNVEANKQDLFHAAKTEFVDFDPYNKHASRITADMNVLFRKDVNYVGAQTFRAYIDILTKRVPVQFPSEFSCQYVSSVGPKLIELGMFFAKMPGASREAHGFLLRLKIERCNNGLPTEPWGILRSSRIPSLVIDRQIESRQTLD